MRFSTLIHFFQCKLILDELNQIIQWIEEQLTPTDICERLGFCNKTSMAVVVSHYDRGELGNTNSSTLCDICMMVVNAVENLLKTFDNNLQEVEDELNEVCDALGELADQVGKKFGNWYHYSQGPLTRAIFAF